MLSTEEYWNNIYKTTTLARTEFKCYSSQYLINLCKKIIPKNENYKLIEIGCSPGTNIVDFHSVFGGVPFGVDYSATGVNLTKETFRRNKFDANNVILSDFLSKDFQNEFREKFDIVMSFGLVEHFENGREATENHLNLLKRGGYLIISIPNFRGFNGVAGSIISKDSLKIHNLDTMRIRQFESMFDSEKIHKIQCCYYGIFSFNLYNVPDSSKKKYTVRLLYLIQFAIDRLLEKFLMSSNIECSVLSPYLVYIGRKL